MRYSHCVRLKNDGILFVLFIVVTSAITGFGYSQEQAISWQKKGKVFSRGYQDLKQDSGYEDKQEFDTRARLENTFSYKEWQDLSLTINVEARYGAFRADDTDDNTDILLREAFVELREEDYTLAIGKQTLTWGKLDDLVILDRMNPQDYRWFTLYEKQDRKDPTLMVSHTYYAESFSLETVWLPVFEESQVDFFGSDWAVFDHLTEIVRTGNYPDATKTLIRMVTINDNKELEEKTLTHSQGGIRFRSQIDDIDYGLYYMSKYETLPTLQEKTPVGNPLKKFLYYPTQENLTALMAVAAGATSDDVYLLREYPRVHIIGGDLETVAGEFGVRAEGAFIFNAPFLRSNFSYVEKNRLLLGAGLDHATAQGWYFNIQLLEDIIFNYSDLFSQEEYTHAVTFTLRKDFLRGKLLFDFDAACNLSLQDAMFNPSLIYKFTDDFEATLGCFFFEGAITTLFGRYDTKDILYVELTKRF